MVSDSESVSKFVEKRYQSAIDYYWKASRHNKRAYKLTRSLVLILGAVVTLVTSLSSAAFITSSTFWNRSFTIGGPVLAVILTIVGGFSQAFQWGAAWNDMVMTAQRLEKERDRFLVTKPEERDLIKEVNLLNDFVLDETEGFFQRILGSTKSEKKG